MHHYDLLLQDISYRHGPLSRKKWQTHQEWHNTVLFHFQVSKEELNKLIPKELTLDTFENKAWISIICYSVKKNCERNFFPIPFITNFTELNILTYVEHNGIKATYILSSNRNLLLSTIYSKLIHGISYKLSEIEHANNLLNHESGSENRICLKYFKKGLKTYKENSLDHWLTERYCRFYTDREKIFKIYISHCKWKLITLQVIPIKIKTYIDKTLVLDDCYPVISHFCEKVEVLLWPKIRIK